MITADIVDWLSTIPLGDDQKTYKVWQGPDLPKDPSPHFVITAVPGGRLTTQDALEVFVFQLRTFGPTGTNVVNHNPKARAAERLARDADKFLLTVDRPIIGSSQVIWITRLGGPPYGQPWDGSAAHRFNFTAMYQMEVESELLPGEL